MTLWPYANVYSIEDYTNIHHLIDGHVINFASYHKIINSVIANVVSTYDAKTNSIYNINENEKIFSDIDNAYIEIVYEDNKETALYDPSYLETGNHDSIHIVIYINPNEDELDINRIYYMLCCEFDHAIKHIKIVKRGEHYEDYYADEDIDYSLVCKNDVMNPYTYVIYWLFCPEERNALISRLYDDLLTMNSESRQNFKEDFVDTISNTIYKNLCKFYDIFARYADNLDWIPKIKCFFTNEKIKELHELEFLYWFRIIYKWKLNYLFKCMLKVASQYYSDYTDKKDILLLNSQDREKSYKERNDRILKKHLDFHFAKDNNREYVCRFTGYDKANDKTFEFSFVYNTVFDKLHIM